MEVPDLTEDRNMDGAFGRRFLLLWSTMSQKHAPRLPDPYDLKDADVHEVLSRLQKILWVDDRDGRVNPNKEWDAETLMEVANALEVLRPKDPPRPVFETNFVVTVVSMGTPPLLDAKAFAELLIAQEASKKAGVALESDVAVETIRVSSQHTLDREAGISRLKVLGVAVEDD